MSLELVTETPLQTAIFFMCLFLAGIIRGCIGFGFSALVIASTSLFINPVLVVPLLMLLELVASIHMLFSVWNDTLWKTVAYLSLGGLITIPLGVYFLSIVSPDTLRLCVAIVILTMALLSIKGVVYQRPLTPPILFTVGCISGLINGIAAVGGLVIATFLTSAQCPARNIRATMVVFFVGTEIIFIASAAVADIFNTRIFTTFWVACIPMFFGIFLGMKLFHRLNDQSLRKMMLWLLCLLSFIGIVRAL